MCLWLQHSKPTFPSAQTFQFSCACDCSIKHRQQHMLSLPLTVITCFSASFMQVPFSNITTLTIDLGVTKNKNKTKKKTSFPDKETYKNKQTESKQKSKVAFLVRSSKFSTDCIAQCVITRTLHLHVFKKKTKNKTLAIQTLCSVCKHTSAKKPEHMSVFVLFYCQCQRHYCRWLSRVIQHSCQL